MKQKLLLFAASVMLAISASAQRTMPQITSFTDMINDGETAQYLYNVGTQKFFAGANDWNTRASVDTKGDSIRFELLESGYYNFRCYPAVNVSKNAWLYVSCNNWDAMWVDAPNAEENTSYPGTDQWKITKVGDVYKIYNDEMFDAYELEDAPFGVAETFQGQTGNTRCYIYYPEQTYTETVEDEDIVKPCFEGAFYDEWKFVSKETYDAYFNDIVVYEAAKALIDAIEAAEAKYPTIDLSAQRAVYNNANATIAELEAAEAAVSAEIVEFLKGQASAENPVDFSTSIQNATFDEVGNFWGWQGTAFGAGGTTSTNAEHYGHTYDTYQDIEGLPAGVYMVACKGYYRYQNQTSDYNAWKAGTPSDAKIYLSCETNGKFSTPIQHVSQGGSMYSLGGAENTMEVTDEENGTYTLYFPNTMEAANYYFHDEENPDRYHNEAFGALVDGETLRIGVISEKSTGSCWSIYDDFQLFYFGAGVDAYQLWGRKVAENNAISFNAPYGAPEKKLYDDAIAALTSASDKDAVMAAISAFETIPDTVAVSIANYALYVGFLEELDAWATANPNFQGPEYDAIVDYLQADAADNDELVALHGYPHGVKEWILPTGSNEGKLSAEEIAEETAYLQNLQIEAMKRMQPGDDVTSLLTNPSFKDGFNGWTTAGGNVGGLAIFPNVEVYENKVDVSQTVSAVPGVYEVSVQAFERPSGNGSYTGEEESKVFLFMNQFQTPVQNICLDAMPDEEAIDMENCYIGDGGGGWPYDYNVDGYGWVPNSMDGASYAFKAGRYVQNCYGLVGEDGVMKIGLTSNGQNCHWVLWANFQLTFQGKEPAALTSIIEYYTNLAMEVTDAGKPDQTALNDAISAADAAQDGNAMYDALFVLIDAYNNALASAEKYIEAEEAINNLYNVYEIYGSDASPEAIDRANNAINEYGDGINDRTYSLAELEGVIAEINGAASALKIPDLSLASDDNPVDCTSIINNPTYEDATCDGWQGSTKSLSGLNRTDMVEYWHGSCDHYQTLYALPAGTYELTVNAYNRYQDNAQNDYNAFAAGQKDEIQTAFMYIKVNGAETAIPVRLIAEGARETADLFNSYSTITTDEGDVYTPNNMQSAGAAFEETDEDGNPLSDEMNYVNRICFTLDSESDVTIGIRNDVTNSWLIWDNWTLTCFGTNSSRAETVGVEAIESVATVAPTAIYTVSGARVNTLQKGINIVKMSDGSVRKVLIK